MSINDCITNNKNHLPPATVAVQNTGDIEAPIVGIPGLTPTYSTIPVRQNSDNQISCDCPCDVSSCCFVFTASLIVLFLILPFIFCDLYFAYNDISCQHDSNPIGFNLSTWLEVSGWSLLGFMCLLAMFFVCVGLESNGIVPVVIIQMFYSLFSFAWLIVGCVMFWRYLDPSGNCNSNVSNYMWARLIIGLVGVFLSSCVSNKRDK